VSERKRMKVLTVVGTRPEIIRLAATINRLERETEHVLVHTGQNYDYLLNEIFFEDLGLRRPDYFLESDTSSLGAVLGSVLSRIEPILLAEDAVVLAVLAEDPRVRGRLVIVSMPRGTAARVAAASLADQVAVTLRD